MQNRSTSINPSSIQLSYDTLFEPAVEPVHAYDDNVPPTKKSVRAPKRRLDYALNKEL